MRRTVLSAVFALGLVFALFPRAYAATYTDEMANIYEDQFRKPFNMRYHNMGEGTTDYSTLTPIGKDPAYIDYRVTGATDVTVYFYSRNGTTATYDKNEKNTALASMGTA